MGGNILLYGANGYTGKLILDYSENYGLRPVIAGRNPAAIRGLSEQHDLPYRVSSLEKPTEIDRLLTDISVVIHAAGPFSLTARPMMEACLRNGVHYLDITGEIEVFEMARSYDLAAKAAGITVMPGTGFDVVPTDCMSRRLKDQLPDASRLELAFTNIGGGVSHGTALTMARSLGNGGAIREKGRIVPDPLGARTRQVDFGKGPVTVSSIPWGDVSTAYYTTGIPDIITYTTIPKKIRKLLKAQSLFNWFLRTGWARLKAQDWVNRQPEGPSPEMRAAGRSFVWGEARNDKGSVTSALLTCADGYTLTANSSLLIARKILDGNYCQGFQTPAGCYGSTLVDEIPGSSWLKPTA